MDWDWNHLGTAAVVVAVTLVVAKVVDARMSRHTLDPSAVTRYRVLRRTITTAIVLFGILSALLTIPAVQEVAAGVLASTAVVGLVLGLAAQRTLSNFVAGLLIAIAQPLRIGDRVDIGEGGAGVVEEIGLTYTFIRLDDGARLVVPNEKLASDTIRNSTIRGKETVAEIRVQVPIAQDVAAAVDALREETADYDGAQVLLSGLEEKATLTVRVPARRDDAEALSHELRLRAHRRLRADGVLA